jgi:hypothetical protein
MTGHTRNNADEVSWTQKRLLFRGSHNFLETSYTSDLNYIKTITESFSLYKKEGVFSKVNERKL